MDQQKLFEAMGIMHRVGEIHSFADILKYCTRGSIAKAIGLGNDRFKKKADDPAKFTDREIEKMAELFKMDVEDVKKLCRRE